MESLKTRVIDFLNNYDTEYQNPHGATIMLFEDLTVYVQVMYPGFECEKDRDIDVAFTCSCDSFEEFISAFEITDFKDLGRIDLSIFEKLYAEGKAKVYCLVGDYELTFTKKGEYMDVCDYKGNVHQLQSLLYKAEEFVEYTRSYYKLEITYPGSGKGDVITPPER